MRMRVQKSVRVMIRISAVKQRRVIIGQGDDKEVVFV
jgi:hypothetical protein